MSTTTTNEALVTEPAPFTPQEQELREIAAILNPRAWRPDTDQGPAPAGVLRETIHAERRKTLALARTILASTWLERRDRDQQERGKAAIVAEIRVDIDAVNEALATARKALAEMGIS